MNSSEAKGVLNQCVGWQTCRTASTLVAPSSTSQVCCQYKVVARFVVSKVLSNCVSHYFKIVVLSSRSAIDLYSSLDVVVPVCCRDCKPCVSGCVTNRFNSTQGLAVFSSCCVLLQVTGSHTYRRARILASSSGYACRGRPRASTRVCALQHGVDTARCMTSYQSWDDSACRPRAL